MLAFLFLFCVFQIFRDMVVTLFPRITFCWDLPDSGIHFWIRSIRHKDFDDLKVTLKGCNCQRRMERVMALANSMICTSF